MASKDFGQKLFQPKPPIQGSFPLDHEGECKKEMLDYMLCISRSKNENTKCRNEAKEYLNYEPKISLEKGLIKLYESLI